MANIVSDNCVRTRLDGQLNNRFVIGIHEARLPPGEQTVVFGISTEGIKDMVDIIGCQLQVGCATLADLFVFEQQVITQQQTPMSQPQEPEELGRRTTPRPKSRNQYVCVHDDPEARHDFLRLAFHGSTATIRFAEALLRILDVSALTLLAFGGRKRSDRSTALVRTNALRSRAGAGGGSFQLGFA